MKELSLVSLYPEGFTAQGPVARFPRSGPEHARRVDLVAAPLVLLDEATDRLREVRRHSDDERKMLAPFAGRLPHGGLVIDHRTRRELYKRSVPIRLVVEAMSFSTEAGCRFATYLPDFQTSLRRDPAGGAFEEWVDGQRQRVVDDPFTYLHEEPLNCLLWTAGQQRTLHLLPLLQARLGRAVRVTQSAPDLLEVIPADVSKAHAATVLVGHLGIEQEQVVAVGDSDNDVELLQWAGLGIAVRGATPAARAAADRVLESAAGAAAAEEIEWIVLGHELAGNSG